MSARQGATVAANHRSAATRVTGSTVAKASAPCVSRGGIGSCSTNQSSARVERVVRSSQISSGTPTNGSLRRFDNASSRPIVVAARATLSQSKAAVASRTPRNTNSRSTARSGRNLTTVDSPPIPFSLDDESLALALARELENERLEDEAFALSLAREQEETSVSDAALAAALAVADNRVSPQPWPEFGAEFGAGDFAVMAAAAALSRGNASMFGVDDYGLEQILALSDDHNASAPPRHPVPSRSQIQRFPTRIVCAETLGTNEDGTEQECPVCFASYVVGDELRTLPCMHCFHTDCIDRWLTSGREGATTCPVCHSDVNL